MMMHGPADVKLVQFMDILNCKCSPEKVATCCFKLHYPEPMSEDLLQNYSNILTSLSFVVQCKIKRAYLYVPDFHSLSAFPSYSNHATRYMNILLREEYCSGGLQVTFCTAVDVVASTAQSVQ